MHTQEEIEESKLELADSLKRLYKNRDFKKIILEAYLTEGSKNLTRNLSRIKEEYKDGLIQELDARSILWKFMDSLEEDARDILEAREM